MEKWLIVADDVTGALDSAVGFAPSGVVEYSAGIPDGVDVAAISTGSRALATAPPPLPDQIERRLVDRLFVKIDSTVRGRPAEHVRVAMDWWHPSATAVICPAAPDLGRTVVDGRVYVHGEPAAMSAAAGDPVAPTRDDHLPTLFDAPLIGLAELPDAIGRLPAVILDASNADDLTAIATVVASAGRLAVPVGSSGLARALGSRYPARASERPPVDDVVVVVTSVHPVSKSQIADVGGRVPIISPPLFTAESVSHSEALEIARSTAARAASVLAAKPGAGVVVIGGDGTNALLSALGAEGVEVLGEVLPGIPWGRIRGGRADGTIIATKSGGFGTAGTLTHLIHLLTEDTP